MILPVFVMINYIYICFLVQMNPDENIELFTFMFNYVIFKSQNELFMMDGSNYIWWRYQQIFRLNSVLSTLIELKLCAMEIMFIARVHSIKHLIIKSWILNFLEQNRIHSFTPPPGYWRKQPIKIKHILLSKLSVINEYYEIILNAAFTVSLDSWGHKGISPPARREGPDDSYEGWDGLGEDARKREEEGGEGRKPGGGHDSTAARDQGATEWAQREGLVTMVTTAYFHSHLTADQYNEYVDCFCSHWLKVDCLSFGLNISMLRVYTKHECHCGSSHIK